MACIWGVLLLQNLLLYLLFWRLRWLGLVYCWHVCHFVLSFLLAILLVLLLADFTSFCVILLSFYVRRRAGFLGRSLWREAVTFGGI